MKLAVRLLLVMLMILGCSGGETPETAQSQPAPEATTTTDEPVTAEATSAGDQGEPTERGEAIEQAESTEQLEISEQEEPMDYKNTVAEMETGKGTIVIRFFPNEAPKHVENFVELSKQGYYNGTKFHRVIPGFMIQGGDPNTKSGPPATWGTGGSGRLLAAEFNDIHHRRGILSMARSSDPNSASSQFFIVVKDSGFLDKQYSVFGEVLSGMDVADVIVNAPRGPQDRPNDPVSIINITIREATDKEASAMTP